MSRFKIAPLLIVVAVACLHAQQPPAQQRPTFTANTDVVMVDVSVRKGGKQVADLTAADFELKDNGVKQAVETVESMAVPIDLSIVVDVSGDPRRPWTKLPTAAKVAADIDADVRKLTKLLRPGDRVRLFAQDTYVQQLWALQPAASTPSVQTVSFDGQSSLYDTLTTILLQPVEPTRRHVVVAATKGLDTISAVTATDVQQVAERSDAQLHLVMLEREADEEATLPGFQCANMSLCRPTYRFWTPASQRLFRPVPISGGAPLHVLLPAGQALKAGADSTGGGLYQGEMLSEPSLYGTFAKAFENFRQSYVLRYTPTGVARTGWHQISVTVPRDKSVVIHARNGYAVDSPAPVSEVPAALATGPLSSLRDIAEAYAANEFDRVAETLDRASETLGSTTTATFIRDFETAKGMSPWPGNLKGEATFALELASTAIFSRAQTVQDGGRQLLARYSRLIRPSLPIAELLDLQSSDFEHLWLTATLALLQGRLSPPLSEPFVERALERFPNEPRFLLARAIVADQRWRGFGTMSFGDRTTATEITIKQGNEVIAAYEAVAAASSELATEARIRLGWFLYRVGRKAEALKQFDAAPPLPQDAAMEYLRHLFKSHLFLSQEMYAEATAEARIAHVILPEAQSARVLLMNAGTLRGDTGGVDPIAENIESAPRTSDPWWMYWLGDYRWYPAALGALRGQIK